MEVFQGFQFFAQTSWSQFVSFNAQINTFINVAFWKIEIYPVDLAISYKKMTSFYFNLEF